MSRLEMVRVGEVSRFIRGITFKPKDIVEPRSQGSVVCMRTKNVQKDLDQNDLIAVPKSIVRRKEQFLTEGDILVSSANSWELVGKCSWVPKLDYEAAAGGFISILRGDNSRVDDRYLFYWLGSPSIQYKLRHCGRKTTNISNLNYELALALEIPLPPLIEQKRIAAILDKADAIRRKRQTAIKLADDFLRAIFLDMFGDPVTNPKGWEVKPLGEMAQIQIGPFGTQLHKEDYIVDGIPLINPSHIVNGKLLHNNKITIIREKYAQLPEYHLRSGDIIMGRRGEMGRCAVVSDEENGWFCGTGSLFLRYDQTRLNPLYFYTVLSSRAIKTYLERESLGATLPNLNKGIVSNIKLPVPPIALQKKYDGIAEKLKSTLEKTSFDSTGGHDLFNSLTQRAFRGEL